MIPVLILLAGGATCLGLVVARAFRSPSPSITEATKARIDYIDELRATRTAAAHAELRNKIAIANKKLTAEQSDAIATAVGGCTTPANVILGVIEAETKFRPEARGSNGEVGLMQVMPATARRLLGKRVPTAEMFKIDRNIELGDVYLQDLHDGYVKAGLESGDEYHATLMAYNAGPAAVGSALAGRKQITLTYYARARKAIARWKGLGY